MCRMNKTIDLVEEIRESVAWSENAREMELPPLEDWIPQQKYQALISDSEDRAAPLELSYLWYTVTVHPDGSVTVEP